MSLKKNRNVDVERSKFALFAFSFVISAILILIGLEWAKHNVRYTLPVAEVGELIEKEIIVEDIIIMRPEPKTAIAAQPPVIDRYVIKPVPEDSTIQETIDTTTNIGTVDTIIDQSTFGEDTVVTIETILDFVEDMPTYIGGLETMYQELGSHLKPNRTRTNGTVYVEFIVETNGEMSNINVRLGVNSFLDNNAMQAVEKLGRWNPGIQNHHPVRVRMLLPIKFTVR